MDKKTKKEPGIKEWAIIFAAGVLLLLLSVPDLFQKEKEEAVDTGAVAQQREEQTEEYAEHMERKLKEMLLKVNGVTSAEVMITVKSTMEKVVLQDTMSESDTLRETDGGGGERESGKTTEEKTAVLAGETPFLTKELTPAVEGVVIVAEGLESEGVLAVTEAVQALFDLPAHKVKIIRN